MAGVERLSLPWCQRGSTEEQRNGAWKHGYYGVAAKAERMLGEVPQSAASLQELLYKDET